MKEVWCDGVFPLLARLLVSVIFVTSAISKIFGWSGNVEFIASKHLPIGGAMVSVLLAGALIVELFGSVCLVSGFQARIAAATMAIYMIPVTLFFHDFMSVNFQKNLGIIGGLLMIAVCGPGSFAFGGRRQS